MMRKKDSLLIISIIISGLFVSCWDDFTERAYYSANITSFGFDAHDACPDIENYIFNIDQLNGTIYNLDSLPYGSAVKSLFPAIKLQSTNGKIYVNDSIWGDKDSIDFTSPVVFKNTSSDWSYTRTYTICVNVHQVDPDSMIMNERSSAFPTDAPDNKMIHLSNGEIWSYFASDLVGMTAYFSADGGLSWTEQSVTGIAEEVNLGSLCIFNSKYYIASKTGQLYTSTDGLSWSKTCDGTNFVTLFGQIKRKYITEVDSIYLVGLVKKSSGEIFSARSNDGIVWILGSVINAEFPVSKYALVKGTTVTGVQFYTIATGLKASRDFSSTVWSTENGLNWILLSDVSDTKHALVKRKGASLFYYDGNLVCFGGIDQDGVYHKDLHVSHDNGKGWLEAPDNWEFLKMDKGLAYAQVYVEHIADTVNDKDREYIWIYGGSDSNAASSSVWKGYLNKMVFARR